MPIVQPSRSRYTTNDLGDRLQIVIPSRKKWLRLLIYGIYLILWSSFLPVFTYYMIRELTTVGSFLLFLILLILFILGNLPALVSFLWQILGKQVIEVSNQSIIIRWVVININRSKEYWVEHINGLRIWSGLSDCEVRAFRSFFGWSFWGLGENILAFDYDTKTHKFGNGVDEAEAKQILSEIQERFPQYRSPGNLTGLQDL